MTSHSMTTNAARHHERTMIVLAAGERYTGTSVSAALVALASSAWGNTLCVEAGERNAGIRWNAAAQPASGFISLSNGVPVQSVALPVTRTLDAIQARGRDDAGNPHQPATAFNQLQGVLHLYETVVVDASTSITALLAACEAGKRTGARIVMVMLSSPGGASLAATHALLKGARRMGARAEANVLVATQDYETAAGVHAMLAAAAERFLGETPGFMGAIPRDASLSTALQGGMTLLDAAAGSPALDSAVAIVEGLRGAGGTVTTAGPAVAASYPMASGVVMSGSRVD